jgi:hypothetical protein
MTADEKAEKHEQQIDLLIALIAKHDAHIEVLDRMEKRTINRVDDHDEKWAVLDQRLAAMAANAAKQEAELNALIALAVKHEERINSLMTLAEIHEKRLDEVGLKIEKNSEQIAALTIAIANAEKQWQACLNMLPRQ